MTITHIVKYIDKLLVKIYQISFNKRNHVGEMAGWSKFSELEILQIREKQEQSLKHNIASGITKPSFKGKTHSNETKQKIIESQAIRSKILLQNGFKINYNSEACKFINKLNKTMNWNLQHAENSGEIECCGYYLDGYDKELNIVFEYDKPKHCVDIDNNILCTKDILRMNTIINKLNCEFWCYNEKLDYSYKI